MRREGGFSLIELLIALGIFALTAGALALMLTRLSERAHRQKTNAEAQERVREVARQLATDLNLVYTKTSWQRPLAYGPQPLLLLTPTNANCALNATVAADGTGTNALYCANGGATTLEARFEFDPAAAGAVQLRPTATKRTQICLTLNATAYDQTTAQYGICLDTETNQMTAVNNGNTVQIAAPFQPGAALALELDYASNARTLRLSMLSASASTPLATLVATGLSGNNARPVVWINSPAQNNIQLDAAIATGGPLRPLLTSLVAGGSSILDAQNQPVNSLATSLDPVTNPQWTLLLPDAPDLFVAASQTAGPDQLALTLNAAPNWTPNQLVTLADDQGNVSLWSVQSIQGANLLLARTRTPAGNCPVRDAGAPLQQPPANNSTLRTVRCVVYRLVQNALYRQEGANNRELATGVAKIALRQVDFGYQTLQDKTMTTQNYASSLGWQLEITPVGDDQPFLIPLDLPPITAPNRNPFLNN